MANELGNDTKANAVLQDMPEDVASLYSWANLHGAKYRDFSAARHEARAQARNRSLVEPPVPEPEPELQTPDAVSAAAAGSPAPGLREAAVRADSEIKAEARPKPESNARGPWEELIVSAPLAAPQVVNVPASAAASPSLDLPDAEPERLQHSLLPGVAAQPHPAFDPPSTATASAPAADTAPQLPVYQPLAARQSCSVPAESTFPAASADAHQQFAAIQPPAVQATERVSSRWYALNSVLNQPGALHTRPYRSREVAAPVLTVFSLAGGVGKTGIVATLGRTLAACGENVLLVDTNSYGLLPLYYGSQDVRPGTVRTFTGSPTTASVQLLSLDAERYAGDEGQSPVDSIVKSSQLANRIVIDVATGSSFLVRQILQLSPRVLVPLAPDISSLASLQAVDALFARISGNMSDSRMSGMDDRRIEPFYLLNGFDGSVALHVEVREILRQRLGERLLPFALRRSPAVTEALAEGMTVVDYSPGSLIAEDYASLSSWIRNLSAPSGSAFRGKRWSEQTMEQ